MVGTGVIDGLKDFGRGALDAFGDFGKGVFVDLMWGFASNLFQGNFGEAFSSAVRGVDRAIFQSTQRFWSGVVDGAQSVANGVTRALGPVGEPLRWVTDRAFDIGHTLMDTAWGMGRDAFRLLPDTATGFIGDVERAIELAADGRWGDAAEQFGLAFANVPGRMAGRMVDMGARFLRGGASMGLTAVGLEPPARRLSEDETAVPQADLRRLHRLRHGSHQAGRAAERHGAYRGQHAVHEGGGLQRRRLADLRRPDDTGSRDGPRVAEPERRRRLHAQRAVVAGLGRDQGWRP